MPQHLLHGAQVCSSFQKVRGKRVAQEVGMHTGRIETGPLGQAAQDEEGARAGQAAALCVEEELRPVPAVEKGATAGEVAPDGLDALTAERDDPLLVTLAEAANGPVLEVDPTPVEADGLADA